MFLNGFIVFFAKAKEGKRQEISLKKIVKAYERTYVRIAELKRPKL